MIGILLLEHGYKFMVVNLLGKKKVVKKSIHITLSLRDLTVAKYSNPNRSNKGKSNNNNNL